MDLNKIRVNEENPRVISNEKFEKLRLSIEKFPKMLALRPIIVDEDGIILGGNMRFRALQKLGWELKPEWFKVADSLSDDEKKRFIVEDNIGFGDWDWDKLSSVYDKEVLEEWGLDVDRWDEKDIVEDEPPEVSDEPAVSKLGEVYQLGKHRLVCGDATNLDDVLKLMDNKKATMVFTDPPYNINYEGGTHGGKLREKILNDKMSSDDFYKFLFSVLSNLMSVTDGAFYVCMSSSELHNLWKAFTDAGGHWQTYIIWAKDAFTLSRSDYQHQFEPVMYGLTDPEVKRAFEEVDEDKLPIMYGWSRHFWYGGRKQGDVWRFERPKVSKEHPTMKPIALCAKAVRNSSLRDQIVVDVFGGSGSTLIACEQIDRICYMMELDPKYCDVIRKRYSNFIGSTNWEASTPKIL